MFNIETFFSRSKCHMLQIQQNSTCTQFHQNSPYLSRKVWHWPGLRGYCARRWCNIRRESAPQKKICCRENTNCRGQNGGGKNEIPPPTKLRNVIYYKKGSGGRPYPHRQPPLVDESGTTQRRGSVRFTQIFMFWSLYDSSVASLNILDNHLSNWRLIYLQAIIWLSVTPVRYSREWRKEAKKPNFPASTRMKWPIIAGKQSWKYGPRRLVLQWPTLRNTRESFLPRWNKQ